MSLSFEIIWPLDCRLQVKEVKPSQTPSYIVFADMKPFGLRPPVSALPKEGKFDTTLFAKKTSYKVFRLKNLHIFAALYPFLPHDLIESKLAEKWNQFSQREKEKYYILVLRTGKKGGKRGRHQKKALKFALPADDSRSSKKRRRKRASKSVDSSDDNGDDESDGSCGDQHESPSDDLNHCRGDAMIPDLHSQGARERQSEGNELKLAHSKARTEKTGQATKMGFESVDGLCIGLKFESKRPSKRKGIAVDELAEWLFAKQSMGNEKIYTGCPADHKVPDVVGESSKRPPSSILKSPVPLRRLQDQGDQGKSKVTFSKRQRVHLEEGGEFSCDAGISDDKEDASSSQEFEKGTYNVGIKWEKYTNQGPSHEYPSLHTVKNPPSHPLQQVKHGGAPCIADTVNSNSTGTKAELSAPEREKESSEPLENAPKKYISPFKKKDKARYPTREKWHLQLFADQNNNSQEEFQEKENIPAGPLILRKAKKPTRSSNKSNTRQDLGWEPLKSPSDHDAKYEDNIQVQSFDSDIELTPVRPFQLSQTARTQSPAMSSSSLPGSLKGFSPLSGVFPLSQTTPSGTPSSQVNFTPRSAAFPMQRTNLNGSPQVTRPAHGKIKLPASAAQTPQPSPAPRRRRAFKLYTPEPLLSSAASVNSQTSLCSQGSPPADLCSDDSDSEESNNFLSDAELGNADHRVPQEAYDASGSEDDNLQEMDEMVCEEGGKPEVTDEMECEESDKPAVTHEAADGECNQGTITYQLRQDENDKSEASDEVNITDSEELEEVHREENAGSDPMDELDYYDLTCDGPLNSTINDETHQIVLDLFTEDDMPPPAGKRYLLGGSQSFDDNSSYSCNWDEDLYG